MLILLSNDDGWRAPGLAALRDGVRGSQENVIVVAPDRNRSGASNSLTLDRPLRVCEEEAGLYSTDGTPTDCVHLAITGLFADRPDMVISGINAGANMGDDVLYSGTVAAATEGRSLGLPALAISLVGQELSNYDTAARVAVVMIMHMQSNPLPPDTILNVNVPDLAWDDLRGFEATRLGYRHPAEQVVEGYDPRGRKVYWIGAPGGEADAGPGTDFNAVNQGKVSITPMQTDLTRYIALEQVAGWVGGLVSPR